MSGAPRVPYARLSALYFAYYAFIGAYMPYFALYLESLGFAAWAIGVLLSAGQFTRIFAPNVWAALADKRFQTAALLRGALLLAAVMFLGLFASRSFEALFVVLMLHAFFASAAMPLVESTTFGHLRERPEGYGPIRLWGSVGFIGAVGAVGWALDRLPTSSLLWMILLPLVAALGVSLVLPRAPESGPRGTASIWAVVRRSEVVALLGAGFLMSVAHGPLYTFFTIYLDAAGYSKTVAGALWSLGVIAEIIVFMAMPRWFARFSPRAILVASLALAVLRFALIGWGVDSLALLLVAQVLHAATFGSFHAAMIAVINVWFVGARRVRGLAVFSSSTYGAGSCAGALLSGLLWERVGPAWTFTAASLVAALGLLLVVWRGKLLPSVMK